MREEKKNVRLCGHGRQNLLIRKRSSGGDGREEETDVLLENGPAQKDEDRNGVGLRV